MADNNENEIIENEFIGLGKSTTDYKGSIDDTSKGEEQGTAKEKYADREVDNQDIHVNPVIQPQVQNRNPTPAHQIIVNLTDQHSPIVLLFGAPSSGKTMTLVRLAKYLRPQGYQLLVDPNFCVTAWEYQENMRNFNNMLDTNYALPGTGRNDFLLIKIYDRRQNIVCQILEGAGEDYFPSNTVGNNTRAQVPFPAYMTNVFGANNKKIWLFLTVPYWRDRAEYVQRVQYCKTHHFNGEKDKCIIVYNQIDRTPFIDGPRINTRGAMNLCNEEYPGLFSTFPYLGPIPEALRRNPFNLEFVPFSTGFYGQATTGSPAQYTKSHDSHPERLWSTIKKCIRG